MSVLELIVKAGYNTFTAFARRTERDELAYLRFASNAYMSCPNRFDDDSSELRFIYGCVRISDRLHRIKLVKKRENIISRAR